MFSIGFVITFIIGIAVGKWYADVERTDAELSDPTVHVIERKLFGIDNINLAYNKIKQIFDENKDKFECLNLEYEEEPDNYNMFYCRYRSIGNKYIIKMKFSEADILFFHD